jgi:hypothetical protein
MLTLFLSLCYISSKKRIRVFLIVWWDMIQSFNRSMTLVVSGLRGMISETEELPIATDLNCSLYWTVESNHPTFDTTYQYILLP